MTETRTIALAVVLVALLLVAGLASWHEKHYARRQLFLLANRVEGLERLIVEDRTL